MPLRSRAVFDHAVQEGPPDKGYRYLLTKPNSKLDCTGREIILMSETPFEAIERLERLAVWHRINAEHAGADWVWEARLRAAEDLERQAAKIRAQLSLGDRVEVEVAAVPGARFEKHPITSETTRLG